MIARLTIVAIPACIFAAVIFFGVMITVLFDGIDWAIAMASRCPMPTGDGTAIAAIVGLFAIGLIALCAGAWRARPGTPGHSRQDSLEAYLRSLQNGGEE